MRGHCVAGVVAVLACVFVLGCSEERRVRSEIEAAFESGDHRETVALCRLARRRGVDASFVYYYEGASLLSLGRDFEAFSRFDDAGRYSAEDRRRGARLLADRGLDDVKSGSHNRGGKRLRKAHALDPTIDFGPTVFLIADECFAEKDFSRAALLYSKAVRAFPDTAACEKAYYNMFLARVALGDTTRATQALDELLGRYPRGQFSRDATFRLEAILFEQAQQEYRSGNYNDAIAMVENLVNRTGNVGLSLKSHYLLGEIHEAQGDYGAAYRSYREVIRGDRGASGRIVQSAREKMDAIGEAGLR